MALAMLLGTVGLAHAQSATWIASSGTWSNVLSWNPIMAPGAATAVTINNTGTAIIPVGVSGTYGSLSVGQGTAGQNGTVVVAGGLLTGSTATLGVSNFTVGTLNISSGTWNNTGNLILGSSGAGVLNVSGGLAKVSGTVTVGSSFGQGGTITLSGSSGNRGTLATSAVVRGSGTGGIVFDGGVLQALGNQGNFLSSLSPFPLQINAGGAFIDTGTFSIGVAANFTGTGALTQMGAGTLTLTSSATNSYAGGTVVSGTLIGSSANLQGNISNAGMVVFDQSGSGGSFAGSISGSNYFGATPNSSVTKQGLGTLTITGTNNTYNGITIIASGTLAVGSGGALKGGAFSSGYLAIGTYTGSTTGGSLLLNGGFINTSSVLIGYANSPGSATITSGTLSSSGGINVGYIGTGNLLLNGGYVVSGSTFSGNSDIGFFSTGSVGVTSGTWRSNAGLIVGDQGTGALNISGGLVDVAGVVTTGNTSGGVGAITVSSTAQFTSTFAPGRGTLATTRIVDGPGSGTLTIDGGILLASASQSDFISGFSPGSVQIRGGGAFIDTGTFAIGIAASLSGTGGLVKMGLGTLTLSGINTFTGSTVVASGTLIGTTSSVVGNINNSANLVFSQATAGTVAGAITGTGSVTKISSGTVRFAGFNSYTGNTTISAGTLEFGTRNSLYSGSTANWSASRLLVSSGATLALNVGGAGEFTSADIDLIKALGTGTSGFTNGSSLGLDTTNASGTFVYSGNIANTNGGTNALTLAKLGAGTLNLSGSANTYTGGTIINGGTLELGSDQAIGSGRLTINGGGIRAAGSPRTVTNSVTLAGDFTLGRLTNFTGSVALANNITITSANPDSQAPSISTISGLISGTYSLTFTQGSNPNGTIALSGNNLYTGGTVIQAGTVQASANTAMGSGTVTVNGGIFLVDAGVTVTNQIKVNGGQYQRVLGSGANLANAVNSTGSFAGGSPDTAAKILQGTLSGTSTLQTSFSATSAASNDFQRQSDVYSLHGTGSDTIVLQLSVGLGNVNPDSTLAWLDPNTNLWVNAVNGNTSGTPVYAGDGAYTSADFVLGTYGIDSATGTVWAVINHNSDFAIIPEPGTWALLVIGGSLSLFARRRKTGA